MKKLNEIYIFDEKLKYIATIDEYVKVKWKEEFFEADVFSIEIDFDIITDVNDEQYQKNKNIFEGLDSMYKDKIYKPRFIMTDFFGEDNIRVGLIESYKINETDNKLEIDGRGFLALFDAIEALNKEYIPSANTYDHAGRIACDILNDNMNIDNNKILTNIFVADGLNNKVGTERYLMTESKQTVYEAVTELLSLENIGFKTIYNKKYNKIYFHAIDTSNKNVNIAISKDDENLLSNEYEFDIGSYKNYCKVIGEGEVVSIDNTNGNIRFCITIESKKKKKDIEKNAYRNMLETEGRIELEKSVIEENYDISITDDINVIPGDTCIVKMNVGYKELSKSILITGIEHEFTNSEYNRKVSFGKPYNSKQELKKTLGVK